MPSFPLASSANSDVLIAVENLSVAIIGIYSSGLGTKYGPKLNTADNRHCLIYLKKMILWRDREMAQ